jgi:transcriptional regulator
MHPNPAFRGRPDAANLDFARERGFGTLTVNGSVGPLAAHVPFVLEPDGRAALLHLVRSNPIVAALEQPLPALLAVSGPDGYISPDWYGLPDQVPTWNYVAVHLRGPLERIPQARLEAVLDTLSAEFERRLAPKAPWRGAKMDPGVRARMMRAVVPVRLLIEEVSGTWKLGQNKPDAARVGAAEAVASGVGQELEALSALMRQWTEDAPKAVDSGDKPA